MLDNRTARYTMFGLLYVAQGAILSYFAALNALYLLSYDLTMSQVGIFSAVALTPFVLKILLSTLSDKVNPLRRWSCAAEPVGPAPATTCLWRQQETGRETHGLHCRG